MSGGSGSIEVADVAVTGKLYGNISGSGRILVAAGTVKDEELRISGSGKIVMDGATGEKGICTISGSGDMYVKLSPIALDATISGSQKHLLPWYTTKSPPHISGSRKSKATVRNSNTGKYRAKPVNGFCLFSTGSRPIKILGRWVLVSVSTCLISCGRRWCRSYSSPVAKLLPILSRQKKYTMVYDSFPGYLLHILFIAMKTGFSPPMIVNFTGKTFAEPCTPVLFIWLSKYITIIVSSTGSCGWSSRKENASNSRL